MSDQVLRAGGLRIAHVIDSLANPSAGPSYSVAGLAGAQAALGHDVTLFSIGDAPDPAIGVRDLRFPADHAALPVLRQMRFSSGLRDALGAGQWDVVHGHGVWLMTNIYPAQVADRQGARLVLAPRGMLSPVALRFSRARKFLFWHLFQRRALARVDLFHATSEAECADIRALGFRQPVAVVPNGVSLPASAVLEQAQKRGNTVISLGRIHPKKGLDRLVRAWAAVERARPEARLLIVGPDEGGHADALRGMVRTLGLARVEIGGPVFGAERDRLLAASDVFVLPTLNENFAMTVAESLAAGTPVISTRGAPWQGLADHGCGWWIDHGEGPLAETILAALDLSPEERKLMGRRGRAWMEREFSWRSVAGRMAEAYDWLGGAARGKPPHVHAD